MGGDLNAMPPRQSLDDNPKRLRLHYKDNGKAKLNPSVSDDPSVSNQRQASDTPLHPRALKTRLQPLHGDQQTGERQFLLSDSHDVKAIGYNHRDKPAATTGTSKPNVLCVTDGMGPCIAVALGAEKLAPDGTDRLPGAKARVFHVTVETKGLEETLKERVDGYKQEGLTVRAALHGGWPGMSEPMAKGIRSTLTDLGVPIEFDESGLKRNKPGAPEGSSQPRHLFDSPLGAVVQDDHSVRFVTDLAYRPVTPRDPSVDD